MRKSVFEERPTAVMGWIRDNYIHGNGESWEELDARFQEFSKELFGVPRTFAAAYSWALRTGRLEKDGKPKENHEELAAVIQLLCGLESLSADQKLSAIKDLVKD